MKNRSPWQHNTGAREYESSTHPQNIDRGKERKGRLDHLKREMDRLQSIGEFEKTTSLHLHVHMEGCHCHTIHNEILQFSENLLYLFFFSLSLSFGASYS